MKADETPPPDRLETALQASLRPVEPSPDFTVTLQLRLGLEVLRPDRSDSPGHTRPGYRVSLALAASLAVALSVGWQVQDLHAWQRAGQAHAQQQLRVALEITSERLGQAQQRIEQFQFQEKQL